MKAPISKKTLQAIEPKGRQYEIRDTKVKGFAIRVYKSGKAAYIVWYARGKAYTIGDTNILTPQQAREEAIEILANFTKHKIDPHEVERKEKETKDKEKQEALSFSQFVENDYFAWALKNHKTGKETVNSIKRNFLPLLKDKKLKEITPWIVEKWRAAKGKEIKNSSLNRELTRLKACMNKAIEWHKLDKNPLAGLKLYKVDSSPKVRFLTGEEETRLREALDTRQEQIRADRNSANQWRAEREYKLLTDLKKVAFADHLKPLVLLSLNTGCRRGELFGLTWQDIDFERQIMTIQGDGTKSGKTLHIPLNQEALSILWQWRKQRPISSGQSNDSGLVFPGKDGQRLDNCNTSWRAILKEAGIENFRWHDMRHSFASKLVMSGVDLTTVRELLGHKDFTMTLRYSHLGDHIKRQAVEKLVNKEA